MKPIISALFTISEPLPLRIMTIERALDKLSETELEKHLEPEKITSLPEADAYMAEREAQSSEYLWDRQGPCLSLLARSRFAKRSGMPGVVFEFIMRTGVSTWTVYRIPNPDDVFDHPVYLERNELMAHSRRPLKLPICRGRNASATSRAYLVSLPVKCLLSSVHNIAGVLYRMLTAIVYQAD